MNFEPEFFQQINPGWAQWFLRRPELAQLTIVFFVSWAMAWIINCYSRSVAVWFDTITHSIPKDVKVEDYARAGRRPTILETFFWTPLIAAALTGVYALFVYRGGFSNLLQIWGENLTRQIGLQNFVGFFFLSTIFLAASLCDIRRKVIPDFIPLAGIVAGIVLALTSHTMFIHVQLYQPSPIEQNVIIEIPSPISQLTFASPYLPPEWGMGTKIVLASVCWAFFVFAFLFRPIRLSRTFRRRLGLYFIRLVRERLTYVTLTIAVVGLIATIWTLLHSDITRQSIVLSSLFGMTFGGIAVWAVRIVGRWTLGMEAIGFGDVTLMMAIGAFTGWQSIPVIFFLSPLTGLIAGVIMLLFGQRRVPLGPFLCISAVVWLLCFDFLWEFCLPLYLHGAATIITILISCLALMAAMLWIIQIIKFKWLNTQTQP